MSLRSKAFEKAGDFRNRALAFASAAAGLVRDRAVPTPETRTRLETSLTTLKLAGHELRKVAGAHAAKFVEQNSTLVRSAGKELSALARSTYQQFTHEAAVAKPRKARAARKTANRAKPAVRARREAKVS